MQVIELRKNCSRCGKRKPLSEFNNTGDTKSGKSSRCSECKNSTHSKKNHFAPLGDKYIFAAF